jgi:FkbM family methyltransferase
MALGCFIRGCLKRVAVIARHFAALPIKMPFSPTIIEKSGWKYFTAPSPIARLRFFAEANRFGRWCVSTHGLMIYCTDLAALCTAIEDIFERRVYDFSADGEDVRVIDGGAHIGIFTLRAKQLFPQAKIIAFEPDESARDLLLKNIHENALSDVKVVAAGLLDMDGYVEFFSDGTDGNTIFSDQANTKIHVTRLSPYLSLQIDFLKLNIEGGELPVLRECQDNLQNITAITLEYHSFPEFGNRLHEILTILYNAGFYYNVQSYGSLSVPNLDPSHRSFLCVAARKMP